MDQHQQAPLSPTPSNDMFMPPGFNALVQHNNAVTSYPRELGGAELHSRPVTRCGTPIQQPMAGGYDAGYYQPAYGQYHSYPAPIPNDNSPYALLDDLQQVTQVPNAYGTPATSPPTPTRAPDLMTTRSGTVVGRAASQKPAGVRSGRVEKNKRAPRAKAAKAAKAKTILERPLSQDLANVDVPVANIAAYVNRSLEERRHEVENGKTPGKVKRPMNAFMLYRKAYQDRAKRWCSQKNHQIVSQVCGASWPMEPDEVRAQYNEWAKLERVNHQRAHPGYKFTPSKPKKGAAAAAAGKRRRFDDSDAGSDADDYDWVPSRSLAAASRLRRQTPSQDPNEEWLPATGRRQYQQQSAYPLQQHQAHQQQPYHGMPTQPYGAPSGPPVPHFYPSPVEQRPPAYGTQYQVQGQWWEEQNPARDIQRQLGPDAVEDAMLQRLQTPSPNMFHGLPNMYPQFGVEPMPHGMPVPPLPLTQAPAPAPQQVSAPVHAAEQQQHYLDVQKFEPQIDPSLIGTGLPSNSIPQDEQGQWMDGQDFQDWRALDAAADATAATTTVATMTVPAPAPAIDGLPTMAPFLDFGAADQGQDPQVQHLQGTDDSWQIQEIDEWTEAAAADASGTAL